MFAVFKSQFVEKVGIPPRASGWLRQTCGLVGMAEHFYRGRDEETEDYPRQAEAENYQR